MRRIIALAVAAAVSSLAGMTPASAQKELACIEKCTRENTVSGGARQTSGTAQRVRACIASCPRAKAAGKAK
jgi:hypothetical protein